MSITALNLIQRLNQHRAWVNAKLISAADTLSDEQLRRIFPIGQGSVWKSLLHLWAGEFVWLEVLLGDETARAPGDAAGKLPGNQEGPGAMQTLAQLAAKWSELSRRWEEYLSQLRDDSLGEVAYRVSTSSGFGRRFGTTRFDILLHVCTHAHYTTAQVMNMLRQLGVAKLPDIMLISLARQESGPLS